VLQIVILTSKNSKTSSIDAASSSLNENLVCPYNLTVTPTHLVSAGEFVAKTIEEDLTRLLALPETGTGVAEGPAVIRT
jgi:hypothetical protein